MKPNKQEEEGFRNEMTVRTDWINKLLLEYGEEPSPKKRKEILRFIEKEFEKDFMVYGTIFNALEQQIKDLTPKP